jgi:hypothetical protein
MARFGGRFAAAALALAAGVAGLAAWRPWRRRTVEGRGEPPPAGQLFTPLQSAAFRVVIALVPLGLVLAGAALFAWSRSGAAWNVGVAAAQPIPFQHDLHVGRIGLDCRFCHGTAERAASAGMPSAETCMTCHGRLWAGASLTEPLRTALALGEPVRWTSVSRLPSHAVFHHAAHVARGVGCETCHGRVDQMTRTVRAEPLSMGWCLDCHRDPAPRLRPVEAVYAMGWEGHGRPMSAAVRRFYADAAPLLTSCSTCHR